MFKHLRTTQLYRYYPLEEWIMNVLLVIIDATYMRGLSYLSMNKVWITVKTVLKPTWNDFIITMLHILRYLYFKKPRQLHIISQCWNKLWGGMISWNSPVENDSLPREGYGEYLVFLSILQFTVINTRLKITDKQVYGKV